MESELRVKHWLVQQASGSNCHTSSHNKQGPLANNAALYEPDVCSDLTDHHHGEMIIRVTETVTHHN